eukprot:1176198-Prymnesium_polylepis.1
MGDHSSCCPRYEHLRRVSCRHAAHLPDSRRAAHVARAVHGAAGGRGLRPRDGRARAADPARADQGGDSRRDAAPGQGCLLYTSDAADDM